MLLWWAELSKTLICLSADGWGWVPSLLVVWPEVTQHQSPQAPCWGEWRTPGGLTPRSISQNCCCLCPCPWGEPQPPPQPLQETLQPPTLADKSGSISYGVTAPFPWVLMHTVLCVCPPRVESLFTQVLSKSCSQIPLAFKVWFSGNSSSRCQTPNLGSLTWGSEPSLRWVDFCGIIVLHFVSHPLSGYEIWFYCDCTPPTISLQLLLCLWMYVIFLVSSSAFLSMTVQQLVVILVLLQEGVSPCPSTLPSWSNLQFMIF